MLFRLTVPALFLLATSAGCREQTCSEQVFGTPASTIQAQAVCENDSRQLSFTLLNPNARRDCVVTVGNGKPEILLWLVTPEPIAKRQGLWRTDLRLGAGPDLSAQTRHCEVVFHK